MRKKHLFLRYRYLFLETATNSMETTTRSFIEMKLTPHVLPEFQKLVVSQPSRRKSSPKSAEPTHTRSPFEKPDWILRPENHWKLQCLIPISTSQSVPQSSQIPMFGNSSSKTDCNMCVCVCDLFGYNSLSLRLVPIFWDPFLGNNQKNTTTTVVFWVGLDLDPKKKLQRDTMPLPKAAPPSVQVPGWPPAFQRTSPSARPDFFFGRTWRETSLSVLGKTGFLMCFFLISEKNMEMLHKFQDLQTSNTIYIYIISYMYIYGRYEYNVFKGRSFKPWILQSQIIPVNTVYSQQNSNGESLYQRKGITFILPLWANPKGNNSTKDPSGEFQEGLFIAASQSSPKIATWIGWWNLGPICTNSNGFSGI